MFAALNTLAEYTYSYDSYTTTSEPSAGFVFGYLFVVLIFVVVMVAASWRIFTKAKQPGWAAIVPIYNTLVMLKIVGRPWWWLLLMLIPGVNFVVAVMVYNDLSKSFGKGVGMTLLIIFLPIIGLPMLAFGSAQYQGPAAAGNSSPSNPAPAAPQPTAVV